MHPNQQTVQRFYEAFARLDADTMAACYALGLGVHALDAPGLRPLLVALAALVVTMAVRYYRLPPPGPVFFVMAASIGAYTPMPTALLLSQVGALFLGTADALFKYYLPATGSFVNPWKKGVVSSMA